MFFHTFMIFIKLLKFYIILYIFVLYFNFIFFFKLLYLTFLWFTFIFIFKWLILYVCSFIIQCYFHNRGLRTLRSLRKPVLWHQNPFWKERAVSQLFVFVRLNEGMMMISYQQHWFNNIPVFLFRAGLQTYEEVPSLLRATTSNPAAVSWPSTRIRLVRTLDSVCLNLSAPLITFAH